MKRPLYSPPDPFSLSPLLSLLPSLGSVGRLGPLTASLYARHEKVTALQKELDTGKDRTAGKRLHAEEAMVSVVLEWLSQVAGQGGAG